MSNIFIGNINWKLNYFRKKKKIRSKSLLSKNKSIHKQVASSKPIPVNSALIKSLIERPNIFETLLLKSVIVITPALNVYLI